MALKYLKFAIFLLILIHKVNSQSPIEVVLDSEISGELPEGWFTNCEYIHSYRDIYDDCLPHNNLPAENPNIGYWVNCKSRKCDFYYTYPSGFFPKSISIKSFMDSGYVGIHTSNGIKILELEYTSSYLWYVDTVEVNPDILPSSRTLYFEVKNSYFGHATAIIDQIRIILEEVPTTPYPIIPDMHYILDTSVDRSRNWKINCNYSESIKEIQACNDQRLVPEIEDKGYWTNCRSCEVIFDYDETIFEPLYLQIHAFIALGQSWIRVWTLKNGNIGTLRFLPSYDWGNYFLEIHKDDLSSDHAIHFELVPVNEGHVVLNKIEVHGLNLIARPTTEATIGLPCRGSDALGNIWEGIGCEMEVRECPQNQTGNGIFWFCGCDGIFEGEQPKYDCTPDWIGRIEEELEDALIDYPEGLPPDVVDIFLEGVELILKDVKDGPNNNQDLYYGQHIGRILNLLRDIALGFECNSGIVTNLEQLTTKALDATTSLLTFDFPWGQLSQEDRAKEITHLIQNYETVTYHLLVSRIGGEGSYRATFEADQAKDLHLVAGVENITNSERLILPSNDESYFELPAGWTQFYQNRNGNIKQIACNPERPENPRFTGFQIPSKTIKDKMRNTEGDAILNGNLMTFSFLEPDDDDDKIRNLKNELKIKIRFKHDGRASHNSIAGGKFNRESAQCAFWDKLNLNWSTLGCRILEDESDGLFTTCECNHMTSFAMLMGVHEDDAALRILTAVLCGISNVFLGITIFVLLTTKSMVNTQGHICIHICSTLFLGNILLVLMNPSFFTEVPKGLCLTIGVALHLVFLWAWAWMAALAFHLFRLVTSMSPNVGQNPPKLIYKFIPYGIPLVWVSGVVGITRMGAYSEGEEDFCWLKGNYIWTFLGPMTILIIFNASVLGYAFWRANKMKNSPLRVKSTIKDNKTSILGWIHLSITFGLTWAFGYFVIISHSIFFAYAFAVLNGLQGFFIFAFHYILKEQFRASLKNKISSIATKSGFTTTESTGLKSKSNPTTNSGTNINTSQSVDANAQNLNKMQ